MALHIIAAILMFLATVASAMGVYMAHFQPDGTYFGTSTTSLSLIAFAVCLTFFMKQMIACLAPCDVCTPAKKK